MKKILLSIVYLISTIAFAQYTVPGVWYSSNKTLLVGASKAGIVLDGELNEISWQNAGYTVTGGVPQFPNKIENKMSFNVSVTSTLTGVPSDDEFVGDASFGLCWDQTNLYIGVVLNNPKDVESLSWEPPTHSSGIEIFIAGDNNNRYLNPNSIPTATGLSYQDFHFGAGYTKSTINKYSVTTPGMISIYQSAASYYESNFKTFVKKVGNDVFFEMAIPWDSINKPLLDPNTNTLACPFVTKAGRQLGFDIYYNIPKSTTTSGGNLDKRAAFKSWNACCINRNWAETINYGTIELTGGNGIGYYYDVNFYQQNYTLTGTTSTFLGISTIPDNIENFTISYGYNSQNNQLPAVLVNTNGLITPLNNGISTIFGTALNYSPCIVKSVTSTVVTVRDVPSLETLVVSDASISEPFGNLTISPNFSPATSSKEFYIRVLSTTSTDLATVNTTTGVIRANGTENGTLIIEVIPYSNVTKRDTATIMIANQLTNLPYTGRIYFKEHVLCGGATESATTLAGYSIGNSLIEVLALSVENNCIITIPGEMLYFYLRSTTNGSVPATFSIIEKNGDRTYIKPKVTSSTFNILCKINNTTIPSHNVRLYQSGIQCENNLYTVTCASTIASNNNELNNTNFNIYPNPSSGQVFIDCLSPSSVQIFNLIGVMVASFETPESHAITLPKGIYFVKVNGNKTSLTKKIIVE